MIVYNWYHVVKFRIYRVQWVTTFILCSNHYSRYYNKLLVIKTLVLVYPFTGTTSILKKYAHVYTRVYTCNKQTNFCQVLLSPQFRIVFLFKKDNNAVISGSWLVTSIYSSTFVLCCTITIISHRMLVETRPTKCLLLAHHSTQIYCQW